jgi:1-acyl-sn-glycerol-3-phosphate acyltransferase
MLARADGGFEDRGGRLNPALAGTRILRTGGHVLETIGRFRVDTLGMAQERRLSVRAERLREVSADLCRLHGFDVRVEGALPRRPAILVANHVSYADAPVLAGLVPCTVIAKGEVRGWPLVGNGADTLGVIFVRRGDALSGARALRQAKRALEAGVSVLGFPEGTTSRGSDVLPFRRGLFGLARILGVPIVPLAVCYGATDMAWTGDSWFLPHYLSTAMRPRSLVRVRLGAPIAPGSAGSPEALSESVRSSVRSLLWRMRA